MKRCIDEGIKNIKYRKVNLIGKEQLLYYNDNNILNGRSKEKKYLNADKKREGLREKENQITRKRKIKNKKEKNSNYECKKNDIELNGNEKYKDTNTKLMGKKKCKDNNIKLTGKKKYKKRNKFLIISLLIVIPLMIFDIFTTVIEPSIIAMCEIRANSIGVSVSTKAVKQVMEEVGYDIELVNLEKDNEGKIIALKANVVEMNYIASLIGSRTQQMYNELTESYVQIPIGNFTGNALLAGRGPRIKVKIMPVGTVGSDFKTEFVSSGINQTRHRVYLQVISSMRVIAPFSTKTIKVVNNVNVAETVLIGNVPSSYYNLEGVDSVVDDSLNLWDE